MPDWVRIGQMVVCLVGRAPLVYEDGTRAVMPVKGGIYTIRDIHKGQGIQTGMVGLTFDEVHNPQVFFVQMGITIEPSFLWSNFRPIKKTSIEQFRKLLAPVKSKKPEVKVNAANT